MSFYYSKISITLPTDLLQQLDAVASGKYLSRSHAIGLAVQSWIGGDSDLTRIAAITRGESGLNREEELARFLTGEQMRQLSQFKEGDIEFEQLFKHLSNEEYFKLLELGKI